MGPQQATRVVACARSIANQGGCRSGKTKSLRDSEVASTTVFSLVRGLWVDV